MQAGPPRAPQPRAREKPHGRRRKACKCRDKKHTHIGVEGSIHRYRQSPVTHANHEETSTNIRPTRSAIIGDLLHEWLTFGNTNPERNQGAKGPLRERPLLSLLARCEGGFAEAPPCHTQERKLHVKASAKRVQDLDKGDIIGGGDLSVGT